MRVVLITLYDQSAYGARCLAASLLRAGHEAWLINFKRFAVQALPREAPAARRELETSGHLPVCEVTPFYDQACPWPTPVSELEKEILWRKIDECRAEVVGFSLTSAHLPLAAELSAELRRRRPEVRQVWGGIHPTMDPAGCLRWADAVCVGEGEEALLEYLEFSARTDIRNFHFKAPDGGVISNPLRPLIQNLDALPYPLYGERETLIDDNRDLGPTDFSDQALWGLLVINSHRGCPFACTYCLHSEVRGLYERQKYLRRKSVDVFLDELESIVARFHLGAIVLWDDIFMIDERWIDEFCRKYPGRIGLPFGGYGHPGTTSRGMLEKLKAAGCYFVAMGIQSGSEYISRDVYNRRTSIEQNVEFGRHLREVGFSEIVYDLMTNCPWEREEDCRATVELLSRMPKASKIAVKQLTIYPFTPIARRAPPAEVLAPEIFFFYNMLYLLAAQPGVDPALLPTLMNNEGLRANPKILETWVQQLSAAAGAQEDLRGRVTRLEKQVRDYEGMMPWGIKRATKHWVGQIRKRLKS